MSMNIDKPLDDIIATKKASRPRRGRGGGGGPGAQAGQRVPSAVGSKARNGGGAAPPPPPPAAPGLGAIVGDKIIVSNFPEDVTEAQIKELFTSTVGPLRSMSLSYDSKGKSKGIATIQFNKAIDANKAYQQYNKRLIDGKRPMKVEIIVDPSRAPPAPLTARLGAAPPTAKAVAAPKGAVSATVAAAGGSARQDRAVGGGRRGRGGRGGGRRGGGGEPRPKATVESLDAEMADYQATKGPEASATTV